MSPLHRVVRHVNQEVTEFYLWNEIFKEFQNVERKDFDHLPCSSFEYIELRHNMEPKKDGSYGHIINR